MNSENTPDLEQVEWNCKDDWAIPLPQFPVDGDVIVGRWFIPSESPTTPSSWIYELANGEVVYEGNLVNYLNRAISGQFSSNLVSD